MNINFQLWIEHNGEIVLDRRLWELLKAVNELQSLSAATKRFNMSYRNAWDKLKKAENILGYKLVYCPVRGQGLSVTSEAICLMEKYEKLQWDMAVRFCKESHMLFPGEIKGDIVESSESADSNSRSARRVLITRSSRNTTFHSRELRTYAPSSRLERISAGESVG